MILFVVYGVTLVGGQGELEARTLAFTTLIIANLGLMLTNRSWTRVNIPDDQKTECRTLVVMAGALLFLWLTVAVPAVRSVFRFSVLHSLDVFICIIAGCISILWFELFKRIRSGKAIRLQT